HRAFLLDVDPRMGSVVRHPQVAILVDGQLMGADEHARAEGFEQLSGRIELKDGVDVCARTTARRTARSGIATPVGHPNRPVWCSRHTRCRSPFPAFRQLAEI